MSSEPRSKDNASKTIPWEGLHGRRYTGIGIVNGGNFDEAEGWLKAMGTPPKLPGEDWPQWAERTQRVRGVGETIAKLRQAEGEDIQDGGN